MYILNNSYSSYEESVPVCVPLVLMNSQFQLNTKLLHSGCAHLVRLANLKNRCSIFLLISSMYAINLANTTVEVTSFLLLYFSLDVFACLWCLSNILQLGKHVYQNQVFLLEDTWNQALNSRRNTCCHACYPHMPPSILNLRARPFFRMFPLQCSLQHGTLILISA